jgi:hypothetical protein
VPRALVVEEVLGGSLDEDVPGGCLVEVEALLERCLVEVVDDDEEEELPFSQG